MLTNTITPAFSFRQFRAMAFKAIVLMSAIWLASPLAIATAAPKQGETWTIDTQSQWQQDVSTSAGLEIQQGMAFPSGETATFQSRLKKFNKIRSARSIEFDQSSIWQNWEPSENVGPVNLGDAPVTLSVGPDNYWMFGLYQRRSPQQKKKADAAKPFESKVASLEGFKIPLRTTPFENQFDAPGGLKAGKGGYHAWQSRDMVNWVHHGPVTEKFSRWVTTAEIVDGKVFIYYDYPNDQDPHVYVDSDLTDGLPGKNMGIAFKDPSDGSDSAVIRDLKGKFHVIYEDWSPIDANRRSWDSPLAGHAVSEDGLSNFKILAPAVDNRTQPTGQKATYKHPHWKSHPDWDSNIAEYEIHKPEQEAYGDWASINIGGQYYLFGDYDPVGGHKMSVGWFTSPSLDQPFQWCDRIGNGHPDPDICFAEGQFYLVTQQAVDYTSPGPWVESVETRVGVDTDNDGKVDHWGTWQQVKETYDHVPGFAKQIKKTPASLDLEDLPAGFGFQFEVKIVDKTKNKSKPILDSISLQFGD